MNQQIEDVTKAAELINAALNILSGSSSSPSSSPRFNQSAIPTSSQDRPTSSQDRPTSSQDRPTSSQNRPSNSFRPTLTPPQRQSTAVIDTARNLISSASRSGSLITPNRRIRSFERLRAASGCGGPSSAKKAKDVEKIINVVLLAAVPEDHDGIKFTVSEDTIISRGIVSCNTSDNEDLIRNKLVSMLKKDWPMIGKNDFNFVKVDRKTVVPFSIGESMEFNFTIIKKLIGQGTLYLQVKREFQFIYDGDIDEDDEKDIVSLMNNENDRNDIENENENKSIGEEKDVIEIVGEEQEIKTFEDIVVDAIREAKNMNFINNRETLLFFQKKFHHGRPLDVVDEGASVEGLTNDITVDRDCILSTTFEELKYVEDYRITFKVDFLSEEVLDYGGPRKEWLELVLKEVYKIYFLEGLRELLSQDYFYVGIIIGISLLQNGPAPKVPPQICDMLMDKNEEQPCIKKMKQGLEKIGMSSVFHAFPSLVEILRAEVENLKVTDIKRILQPVFSPAGSNALIFEKKVFTCFLKYLREVAAGRRKIGTTIVQLADILQFVTGASSEPIFGYMIKPKVTFASPNINYNVVNNKDIASFVPTTHTCSNELTIPRPTHDHDLPEEHILFEIYDTAFTSKYFGIQ